MLPSGVGYEEVLAVATTCLRESPEHVYKTTCKVEIILHIKILYILEML